MFNHHTARATTQTTVLTHLCRGEVFSQGGQGGDGGGGGGGAGGGERGGLAQYVHDDWLGALLQQLGGFLGRQGLCGLVVDLHTYRYTHTHTHTHSDTCTHTHTHASHIQ